MVEQRWHRPGLVGPAILVFIGIALLLSNLNLLHVGWWDLLQFWPLILILAGLDLLVRHNRVLSALLAVGIVALLAGLFYAMVAGAMPVRSVWPNWGGSLVEYPASADLRGAKRVDVDIRMGAGALRLSALSDSARLFEGTLSYPQRWGQAPSVSYSTAGEQGYLSLQSRSKYAFVVPFGGSGGGDDWIVGLSREVPLGIRVDGGASTSRLDLRNLRLEELRVQGGIGRMEVFFPTEGQRMTARIDGGVGEVVLHVPESVAARLVVRGGLGSVHVSSRFQRVGDHTYETPGYSTAANQLDMTVNGGVGALRVD